MNRIIPLETKVKVMQECLSLVNVEKIAASYEVSAGAIYYWFNEKVKPAFKLKRDFCVHAKSSCKYHNIDYRAIFGKAVHTFGDITIAGLVEGNRKSFGHLQSCLTPPTPSQSPS